MRRPGARGEDPLPRPHHRRFVDLRLFAEHFGDEFRSLEVVDLNEQLDLRPGYGGDACVLAIELVERRSASPSGQHGRTRRA